jgi:hypothetical protein
MYHGLVVAIEMKRKWIQQQTTFLKKDLHEVKEEKDGYTIRGLW